LRNLRSEEGKTIAYPEEKSCAWSLGLVFGIYFLAVLLLIGVPYMKFLYP
jgi:hypothetical protein